MPSWVDELEQYRELTGDVRDVVRLTTKDNRFWKLVGVMLAMASLGQFSRQRFMEGFATTLGPIQAYPRTWSQIKRYMLVHESQHTRQFLFAGWFVPLFGWVGRPLRVWAGLLPMALVYGLFPLPVFFAWGRFRLELDADAHAWRAALRNQWMTPDEVRDRAQEFAGLVSSWAYLKSWPVGWTRKAFAKRAEIEIELWQKESLDRTTTHRANLSPSQTPDPESQDKP